MDPTPVRDDEWLMAQAAQDRRDALEALVRRYASPLYSFIHHLVGDAHKSEELFQEVFLALWAKRGQYWYPRPFRPWLYAIALNKCRASFRGPAARAALPLEEVAVSGPSPTDTAIATETAELVATAVARLPEQQRVVVVLRVWQGLSYAEIAAAVGCSEGTVRSHMHHGLRALRKHLEPLVT
jgi:RNA polymerase sigma-70 factor (ECF subfamily)